MASNEDNADVVQDINQTVLYVQEDSADEEQCIDKIALYVELPTRPIDLDTIPQDGNEFIHKSRLEDASLSYCREEDSSVKPPEENLQKLLRQWARNEALKFRRYGLKITTDKYLVILRKKFPKKLTFPKIGPNFIQDWCHFCLGSKLCSKIYDEKYKEPDEKAKGNLPVLSIIVHFDEHTAFTVLKHLHEWFLCIGMKESLGRWVYAVLACIRKPLDDNSQKLIETFYSDCKKRLRDCDELESSRLYLISAILEYYFCVNSDKIGSKLENFLGLRI